MRRGAAVLLWSMLLAGALGGCRREAGPGVSPTAVPAAPAPLAAAQTPTVVGMPVDTTPSESIYDRAPGVLHEEASVSPTPEARRAPTP